MVRFVGTWKLVSFELRHNDGNVIYPFGENATGYLLYNLDGYMSVAFMRADRSPFSSPDMTQATLEEKGKAFDETLCYCGKYTIHDNQITHHIEVSLFPNWIGLDQIRFYEFSGNLLTLSTPPLKVYGKTQVAKLIWERVNSM